MSVLHSVYMNTLNHLGFKDTAVQLRAKGRISSFPSISRQLLKAHYDGYHPRMSRQLTTALKRYINTRPKHERRTPQFVGEIRRKILCLHEYNLQIAKIRLKYPRSEQLDALLIQYIELECDLLYDSYKEVDKKHEEDVTQRVLRLLSVIILDALQNSEVPLKTTIEACNKALLKLFASVRVDCVSENNVVASAILKLLDKLCLLDEVNKLKGKNIPFHQDTFLRDPLVSTIRQTLTTSDYESDDNESEDDVDVDVKPVVFHDVFNSSLSNHQVFNNIGEKTTSTYELYTSRFRQQNTLDIFEHNKQTQNCVKSLHLNSEIQRSDSGVFQVSLSNQTFFNKSGSALSNSQTTKSVTSYAPKDLETANTEVFLHTNGLEVATGINNFFNEKENVGNVSKNVKPEAVNELNSSEKPPDVSSSNATYGPPEITTPHNKTAARENLDNGIVIIEILDDEEEHNGKDAQSQLTNSTRLLTYSEIKLEENEENHSPNFSVTNSENDNQNFLNSNKESTRSSSTELNRLKSNSSDDSAKDAETSVATFQEDPVNIIQEREETTLTEETDNVDNNFADSVAQEKQLIEEQKSKCTIEFFADTAIVENVDQTEDLSTTCLQNDEELEFRQISTVIQEKQLIEEQKPKCTQEKIEDAANVENVDQTEALSTPWRQNDGELEFRQISNVIQEKQLIEEQKSKCTQEKIEDVANVENVDQTEALSTPWLQNDGELEFRQISTVIQEKQLIEEQKSKCTQEKIEDAANVENVDQTEALSTPWLQNDGGLEFQQEKQLIEEHKSKCAQEKIEDTARVENVDQTETLSTTYLQSDEQLEFPQVSTEKASEDLSAKTVEVFREELDADNLNQASRTNEEIVPVPEEDKAESENIAIIEDTEINEEVTKEDVALEEAEVCKEVPAEVVAAEITKSSEEVTTEVVVGAEIEVNQEVIEEVEAFEETFIYGEVTRDVASSEETPVTEEVITYEEADIVDRTGVNEYSEEVINEIAVVGEVDLAGSTEDNVYQEVTKEVKETGEGTDGIEQSLVTEVTFEETEVITEETKEVDVAEEARVIEDVLETDVTKVVEATGFDVTSKEDTEVVEENKEIDAAEETEVTETSLVVEATEVEVSSEETRIVAEEEVTNKLTEGTEDVVIEEALITDVTKIGNFETEVPSEETEVITEEVEVADGTKIDVTADNEVIEEVLGSIVTKVAEVTTEEAEVVQNVDAFEETDISKESEENKVSEKSETVTEEFETTEKSGFDETNSVIETTVEIPEKSSIDIACQQNVKTSAASVEPHTQNLQNETESINEQQNDTVQESVSNSDCQPTFEQYSSVDKIEETQAVDYSVTTPDQVSSNSEKTSPICQQTLQVYNIETGQPTVPNLPNLIHLNPDTPTEIQITRDVSQPLTIYTLPPTVSEAEFGEKKNADGLEMLADIACNREAVKTNVEKEMKIETSPKRRRSKVKFEPKKKVSRESLPRAVKQFQKRQICKGNENKRITRNRSFKLKTEASVLKETQTQQCADDTNYKPHTFISMENSILPPRTNNVYAQKRLMETNTTSEDSNDSCESTLFIDLGENLKNVDKSIKSVYEEETICDMLEFVTTENKSDICISIPENETCVSDSFHILKQIEDFVDNNENKTEQKEQIEIEPKSEENVEARVVKTTDHSIQTILNKSPGVETKIAVHPSYSVEPELEKNTVQEEQLLPTNLTLKDKEDEEKDNPIEQQVNTEAATVLRCNGLDENLQLQPENLTVDKTKNKRNDACEKTFKTKAQMKSYEDKINSLCEKTNTLGMRTRLRAKSSEYNQQRAASFDRSRSSSVDFNSLSGSSDLSLNESKDFDSEGVAANEKIDVAQDLTKSVNKEDSLPVVMSEPSIEKLPTPVVTEVGKEDNSEPNEPQHTKEGENIEVAVKELQVEVESITLPDKKRSTKKSLDKTSPEKVNKAKSLDEPKGRVLENKIKKMKEKIEGSEKAKKNNTQLSPKESVLLTEDVISSKEETKLSEKSETSKKDVSHHRRRRSRSSSKPRTSEKKTEESRSSSTGSSSERRYKEKHHSDSDSDRKRRSKSKSLDNKNKETLQEEANGHRKRHRRSSSKSKSVDTKPLQSSSDKKEKQSLDNVKKRSRSKSPKVKDKSRVEEKQKVDKKPKNDDSSYCVDKKKTKDKSDNELEKQKSEKKKSKDKCDQEKTKSTKKKAITGDLQKPMETVDDLFKIDEKLTKIKSKKQTKPEDSKKFNEQTEKDEKTNDKQSTHKIKMHGDKINEKDKTKVKDKLALEEHSKSSDKPRRSNSREKKLNSSKSDKRNKPKEKSKGTDRKNRMKEDENKEELKSNHNNIHKENSQIKENENKEEPRLSHNNIHSEDPINVDDKITKNNSVQEVQTTATSVSLKKDERRYKIDIPKKRKYEPVEDVCVETPTDEPSVKISKLDTEDSVDVQKDENIERPKTPTIPIFEIQEKTATVASRRNVPTEENDKQVLDIPASYEEFMSSEKFDSTSINDKVDEVAALPVSSVENVCNDVIMNPASAEKIDAVATLPPSSHDDATSINDKVDEVAALPVSSVENVCHDVNMNPASAEKIDAIATLPPSSHDDATSINDKVDEVAALPASSVENVCNDVNINPPSAEKIDAVATLPPSSHDDATSINDKVDEVADLPVSSVENVCNDVNINPASAEKIDAVATLSPSSHDDATSINDKVDEVAALPVSSVENVCNDVNINPASAEKIDAVATLSPSSHDDATSINDKVDEVAALLVSSVENVCNDVNINPASAEKIDAVATLPPSSHDDALDAEANVEKTLSLLPEDKGVPKTPVVPVEISSTASSDMIETSTPMKMILGTETVCVSSSEYVNNVLSSAIGVQVLSTTVDSTVKHFPDLPLISSVPASIITDSVVTKVVSMSSIESTPSCSTSADQGKPCLFTFNDGGPVNRENLNSTEIFHTPIGLEDISPTKLPLGSNQSLDFISPSASIAEINNSMNLVQTLETSSINFGVPDASEMDEQAVEHNYTFSDPLLGGNNEDKTILTTGLSLTDSPEDFQLNESHLEGLSFMEENGTLDDLGLLLPCKKEKPDFDTIGDDVIPKPEDIQNSIKQLNMLVDDIRKSGQPKTTSVVNTADHGSNTDCSVSLGIADAITKLLRLGGAEVSTQNNSFSAIPDIDNINIMESNVPSSKPILEETINDSNSDETTILAPICNTYSSFMSNETNQKVVVEQVEQQCSITSLDQLKKDFVSDEKTKPSSNGKSQPFCRPSKFKTFLETVRREANKNETTKVKDEMENYTVRRHNRTPVYPPKKKNVTQQQHTKSPPRKKSEHLSFDTNVDNKSVEENVKEGRIRVKTDLIRPTGTKNHLNDVSSLEYINEHDQNIASEVVLPFSRPSPSANNEKKAQQPVKITTTKRTRFDKIDKDYVENILDMRNEAKIDEDVRFLERPVKVKIDITLETHKKRKAAPNEEDINDRRKKSRESSNKPQSNDDIFDKLVREGPVKSSNKPQSNDDIFDKLVREGPVNQAYVQRISEQQTTTKMENTLSNPGHSSVVKKEKTQHTRPQFQDSRHRDVRYYSELDRRREQRKPGYYTSNSSAHVDRRYPEKKHQVPTVDNTTLKRVMRPTGHSYNSRSDPSIREHRSRDRRMGSEQLNNSLSNSSRGENGQDDDKFSWIPKFSASGLFDTPSDLFRPPETKREDSSSRK